MDEILKHKIDMIVEHATVSPWKRRFLFPGLDESLIYHIRAHYFLIVKNGKKYSALSYASNIIDAEEQKKQTYTQLEELKYHKINNTKKVLKDFIETQLKKGTGLLGHRGYFKFVDIKAR